MSEATKKWAGRSKWFVVILILGTAAYDLVALALGGEAATISQVTGLEGSFASPLVPFAVGFTMGHLFWPQKRKASHGAKSKRQ
jgi:hypothetical protein